MLDGHGKVYKVTAASLALQEGEHFASHCDGMYANDNDECSIYSVVLYLNEARHPHQAVSLSLEVSS